MLELGAYWAHYSMWLKSRIPGARVTMAEPDPDNAAVGRANLTKNGIEGTYIEDFVGDGRFELDAWFEQGERDRLDVLHCDIQGFETEMLSGARAVLEARRVDYWFISTHSQKIHREIERCMREAGYRIEVFADFDQQTTSHDGFILAMHPKRPAVIPGPAPLGRSEIAQARPQALVESILPRLARPGK